jgi:hypothetical protein
MKSGGVCLLVIFLNACTPNVHADILKLSQYLSAGNGEISNEGLEKSGKFEHFLTNFIG